MAIATLNQPQAMATPVALPSYRLNKLSLASALCLLLFVSYFLVPRSVDNAALQSMLSHGVFFALIMPVASFVLAILSVRQIKTTGETGAIFGYASLAFTSLYFITGLAIPFVLLGCYILYAYVL